jgi:phosphoenolpyruvate---glycerone phosphotransferase subunit DhaL
VTWVEHLGDQDHLHIQLVDHDFVTLCDPESGLAPGDRVAINIVNPLFFDSADAGADMSNKIVMDARMMRRLIVAVADAVIAHADELTALDQAIGDGDHGINMKRGFEAVRADASMIAQKTPAEALRAIGMQLVMKVGGASGPLYGTLFMALGREIGEAPDGADLARAFARAVSEVKARGKSEEGQKTMLDVFVPIQKTLEAGGADLVARLPTVVAQAAEATVPMLATRGGAAFLGERSIGHIDQGARSASLIVTAACRAVCRRRDNVAGICHCRHRPASVALPGDRLEPGRRNPADTR